MCAVLLVCVASFAYTAITLSSFTATTQSGKVIVKWITAYRTQLLLASTYTAQKQRTLAIPK